jgi:small subunit ribosomal protein S16
VAVKIRLKRLGKIRSPHYRIVVADARTKRDGRSIEEIGKYHPKNDPSLIEVDSERAQYWLSVGAQPTEAVVALFKRTGDWQKFSGDTSPSGVLPQKEKADKTAAFNRALAESGDEPSTSAIASRGSKPTSVIEPSAEGTSTADEA